MAEIRIEPDTQESREIIFCAIASDIAGEQQDRTILKDGDIQFTITSSGEAVKVNFNGQTTYIPKLDYFQELVTDLRNKAEQRISVTIE